MVKIVTAQAARDPKPLESGGALGGAQARQVGLISVIVPMYNAEKYLAECVDSVLAQTYPDFEVILVNDGSTDSTEDIAQQYAAKDNRVRVVTQPNAGLSGARNTGIEQAKGEYLFFLDADDALSSEALEYLYQACETQQAKMAVVKFTKSLAKLTPPSTKIAKEKITLVDGGLADLLKALSRPSYPTVAAWGKLYHYTLLNTVRFPEKLTYEDTAFYLFILDQLDKVAFCDIFGYYYRTQPDSITNKKISQNNFSILDISKQKVELCETKHPDALPLVLRNCLNDNDFVAMGCAADGSPLAEQLFKQILALNRELANQMPIRRLLYRNKSIYWGLLTLMQHIYFNDRIRNIFKRLLT